MVYVIGTIWIMSLLGIGFCIYKTYREKHKLTKIVARILHIGFVIVLFNTIALFTTNAKLWGFSYSIYFVSTDWLLYYLLTFSFAYIGDDLSRYANKKILCAILGVDSISVLLNNVFGHLYSVEEAAFFNGYTHFEMQVSPIFYVHYGAILFMAAICLYSLYHRAFTAPTFYRGKYFMIAFMTSLIIVLNVISYNATIDLSIIVYGMEGVCIYYCAIIYTPQKLLPKSLFMVAQRMEVALFVLDIEGNKLYSNAAADALLKGEEPLVDISGHTLEQWCRQQYMAYAEEFKREMVFFRGDEELILKIQLQRVVDSHSQLQGGYFIMQDRTEEINNLRRENYLATHDKLTGLYNKEHFYEKAEKYIKRYMETDLLMICTDIKDFKMINDVMGTRTGDIVLKNFAEMLKNSIEDALLFGRLGNDVLAVLMAKSDYREEDFIQADMGTYFSDTKEAGSFPIVNYVGVYEITKRNMPVSVMCDRARMAIATIKGNYYKKVAYYDNVLRENILFEQELIADLNDAIAEGQLKMFLQPQMSKDGKLRGAEALVRWMHPEKGQILPGDFVPVFEKNGLISDVDRYIWELACKQLRKWKDEGRDDIYISVNISPRDFYFMNIYQIFTELVEQYDISPQNLKLEITETAIVLDLKRQMELIARLRGRGFIVEMDDFGSGYSSLNMLKDIHVDILKIDMAFLRKAEDEERSMKILQMIIALSNQLGMPVITEGVESAEQVEELTRMGCNIFQGYYFAKPMAVEQFEETYMR